MYIKRLGGCNFVLCTSSLKELSFQIMKLWCVNCVDIVAEQKAKSKSQAAWRLTGLVSYAPVVASCTKHVGVSACYYASCK